MHQALQHLAELSAAHDDAAKAQRRTLADMRETSLALLRRGAPVEAVARAAGVSTVAIAAWDQRPTPER